MGNYCLISEVIINIFKNKKLLVLQCIFYGKTKFKNFQKKRKTKLDNAQMVY